MSTGKSVAQGGHAVQLMLERLELQNDAFAADWQDIWRDNGITKVVLGVNSTQELDDICHNVDREGYIIDWVIDEGRTEIPEGSLTAACLQPMPRKIAKKFVGGLKLL